MNCQCSAWHGTVLVELSCLTTMMMAAVDWGPSPVTFCREAVRFLRPLLFQGLLWRSGPARSQATGPQTVRCPPGGPHQQPGDCSDAVTSDPVQNRLQI